MSGNVILVGAGPGDAGLLTLRGKAAIEAADVVVYDALVGDAILALVPKTARCINVGKRSHNHTKTQDQINQILLEEAQAGHTVVRLKGGDPFLFGRGGEELELLSDHGIPFEIVPGITSAIAVPAYNGIPVTHRDFCSSVHVITAHKRQDQPLDLDFDALVRLKGTLVFLMGVTALQDICAGLLTAGMAAETPAAVLHRGTSSLQKRVVSTLQSLPADAKAMEAPSIIVVGPVCGLSERFAWAEKRPLFGQKYLVTRPRERASGLSQQLRALGAEVVELPTIEIQPLAPTALQVALSRLDRYRWLVLTSPSGVRVFWEALRAAHLDVRALAGLKIAALGAGTGAALEDRGIVADLIPPTYDAQHLGKALAAHLSPGDGVLIARAKEGSAQLIEELQTVSGLVIDDIATYDTVYAESPILEPEILPNGNVWAVFTSASTVRGFRAAAKGADLTGVKALCIGKQTEAQAAQYGMNTHTAQQATVESLVALAVATVKEEA